MMNKETILIYLEKALIDYQYSLWFSWLSIIPVILNTEDGFCLYFKCTLGVLHYNDIIDELRKDKESGLQFKFYWYPIYDKSGLSFFRKPFIYRINHLKRTIKRLKDDIFEKQILELNKIKNEK